MPRHLWPLGLAGAFALGLTVGQLPRAAQVDRQAIERELGENRPAGPAAARPGDAPRDARAPVSGIARRLGAPPRPADAGALGADGAWDSNGGALARPGQRGADGDPGPAHAAEAYGAAAAPAPPGTVEAALERFYKYLDELGGLSGRARWQRGQQFLEELRAMGSAGVDALMRVLGSNAGSEERRMAAQFLGDLKAAGAVPSLLEVLSRDDDVLLRRTAAAALRRLQTPDAVSAMQSLLSNPGEDRFVRMSAASGLAHMGRSQGVAALVQIFDEANADGRGRDMAFRSLSTLGDDRTLAFMRRVVTSDAELTYRLQAIRFLAAQGDRQAITSLQQVVHAPGEQPSIRDAAAKALAAIGG